MIWNSNEGSGSCGQGEGDQNLIFCGRHKWMAPKHWTGLLEACWIILLADCQALSFHSTDRLPFSCKWESPSLRVTNTSGDSCSSIKNQNRLGFLWVTTSLGSFTVANIRLSLPQNNKHELLECHIICRQYIFIFRQYIFNTRNLLWKGVGVLLLFDIFFFLPSACWRWAP